MSIVEKKIPTFDTELRDERDYWVTQLSGGIGLSRSQIGLSASSDLLRLKRDRQTDVLTGVISELRKLTGDSHFLIYTAFMAALKICLHNYTGSSSIVVGSPCRHKEGSAAPKTNALALLDEVAGHLTVQQFLLQVRGTLVEAYARQRYPCERLVKDLGLEEPKNQSALFDIALVFQRHPR